MTVPPPLPPEPNDPSAPPPAGPPSYDPPSGPPSSGPPSYGSPSGPPSYDRPAEPPSYGGPPSYDGSQAAWAPPQGPPAPDGGAPAPTWPASARAPKEPWISRREVRAALLVVGALLVLGVAAGFVWLGWAPSRGIALALGPDSYIPDETENFVAADGRYAVITAAVGALSGVAAWLWRSARGPLLALGLAVGSFAGAALTALVGRVFGGGVTGAATQQIVTPTLELRATGLLALQAAVALLVYGLSVTVSARDDLGVDGVDGVDRGDRVEPTADSPDDARGNRVTRLDAPAGEAPRA